MGIIKVGQTNFQMSLPAENVLCQVSHLKEKCDEFERIKT